MEEYIKKNDAYRIALHQTGAAVQAEIADLSPEEVISVSFIRQIAEEQFEIEQKLRGRAGGFYAIRGGMLLELLTKRDSTGGGSYE